jgi:Uma2 family endonuclease
LGLVAAYAIDMTAARSQQHVSVEDYLSGELASQVKHEYLGGFVYAMAGGTNAHNLIASNVLRLLRGQLRGKPCRPYNSDTKIRVKLPTHVRMYYPDASVICDSNPPTDSFQDQPVVIAEVLSSGTRRVDHAEKRDAYLTISTLFAYFLIEQELPAVTVYRRTDDGFVREYYSDLQTTIPLAEIGTALPMNEIYDGVEFVAEPDEEDE